MSTRFEPIMLGVLAVVVGIALLLTSGCGGSVLSQSRKVVMTAAEAVAASDAPLASAYTRAADDALERSGTIVDYRNMMGAWNEAVRIQRATITSLQAAEAALDTWQRTSDKRPFMSIIGCAARSVRKLVETLRQLRVVVPGLVTSTAELLAQYLAGACDDVTP